MRDDADAPGDRSVATRSPDLEWCHGIAQDVSRTFAITIDVLADPMASAICVGYLCCRIPDTVEDASHVPPERQVDLLRTYDRVLDPDDPTAAAEFREAVDPWVPDAPDRSADWDLVAETPRVVGVFERQPPSVQAAIRPPARELVTGMATFVERYAAAGGIRIQSREELREYCHYAAGTVGELVTNLVTDESTSVEVRERLYDTAESFGLALQLVNVSKDVHDDFHEENNVYLPAEWLAEAGVPQEAVCDPTYRSAAASVVASTADYARSFLDDAQTYLELVPETNGNRVAAWAIPYLLAVGTLRELDARPADALTDEGVKVSRSEVAAVIDSALDGLDGDRLTTLRETIAERPLDRA